MYIDHVNQRIFSILEEFDWTDFIGSIKKAGDGFDHYADALNTVKKYGDATVDNHELATKDFNLATKNTASINDVNTKLNGIGKTADKGLKTANANAKWLGNIGKMTVDDHRTIGGLGAEINKTQKSVEGLSFKNNLGIGLGAAGLGLGGMSYLKQKRLENQLRG